MPKSHLWGRSGRTFSPQVYVGVEGPLLHPPSLILQLPIRVRPALRDRPVLPLQGARPSLRERLRIHVSQHGRGDSTRARCEVRHRPAQGRFLAKQHQGHRRKGPPLHTTLRESQTYGVLEFSLRGTAAPGTDLLALRTVVDDTLGDISFDARQL